MLPYIPDYPIIKDCILISKNNIELATYDNEENCFITHEGKVLSPKEFNEIVNIIIKDDTRIIECSYNETITEQFIKRDFYDSAMLCFNNKKCPSDTEIIESFHDDEIEFTTIF